MACVLSAVLPASWSSFSDILTDSIEDGINSWIIEVCDSVFAIGTDTNVTWFDPISQGIFRTATYTYNPFENQEKPTKNY